VVRAAFGGVFKERRKTDPPEKIHTVAETVVSGWMMVMVFQGFLVQRIIYLGWDLYLEGFFLFFFLLGLFSRVFTLVWMMWLVASSC